jgi:hypothetical protein
MPINQPSPTGAVSSEDSVVPFEQAIQSDAHDVLMAAVSNHALNEDLTLNLLKRADLPGDVLERLSKNAAVMKSRRVKLALVEHPKTPRQVSLPIVRHLFTFDLVHLALTPAAPADVKAAADMTLCNRIQAIPSGERLSLAHRASGRVASELVMDAETRVTHAALDNPRLTEAYVVKAVMRSEATANLIYVICQHSKWSLRREVRIALLRNQHTPMARALEFARSLPSALAREILHGSHLPAHIKEYLLKMLDS